MLIPKANFIGLEGVVHLAAGGESPMLKSNTEAIDRFLRDKAQGELGRARFEETYHRCKEKAATLLGGDAEDYALLSSSSEGINLLAYALDWQAGDNVVVADIEFPSDILPWTTLEKLGVELRIVRQRNWKIHLQDIEAQMDQRTRVVAASHVSYFTGQRLGLTELSSIVRSKGALLLLDATHSAGVIPVQANLADVLVTSCYKWLLATHGVAIFYWNRDRLPNLSPPFLGWNSGVTIPDWTTPTEVTLPAGADRFVPGNPSFISIYILENALREILNVGLNKISKHVLRLSGKVRQGLQEGGWELMTPAAEHQRAGNVCFTASNVDDITSAFEERKIIIWGSYAGVNRVRVSTHVYNSDEDVDAFLQALQEVPSAAAAEASEAH